MILDLDHKCPLCSISCSSLQNKINHFYETNFNLNENQLYATIHSLINSHIDELKRQGLKFVNISLSDVSFHFTNCHISEKNIIARDIRAICSLQELIQEDTSKISSWIKLVALKSTLLRQLKAKCATDFDLKPYEFS